MSAVQYFISVDGFGAQFGHFFSDSSRSCGSSCGSCDRHESVRTTGSDIHPHESASYRVRQRTRRSSTTA